MSVIDADVVVVGAGPAGSATATHLARHGLRRFAAGEEHVPAGEGLRRRSHPTRHSAVDPARHRHLDRGRLAAQQGPADLRRSSGPSSWPGPSWPTSRRTAWSGRAPTSTTCWPATRWPRAPSCTSWRNVIEPIIDDRTGRIVGVTTKDGRRFTAPHGGGRRRQLDPAEPGHGADRARGPADGGRRAHLLPPARGTATTTWSPGWSSGTASRARAICCPATAGSSAWATAPATSAWAS